MSVCVVLAQFDSLVTRMESLSSKLSTKRIRPTRDQLNDFQNLHTRLKAALADYDAGIEKLLAAGYPNEKDICIADRVRSAKDSGPITSPTLTIFKRNMALIFMGPKTSNLDSNQVKTKNKQIEMRCEILRSQNIHILIMWAMTLQPSTWKTSGGMTDMTFSFLIKDLQDERMNRIPRKISETIQSLAEEEPLKSSGFFKAFVEIVSKTELDQEHAAGIQPPLKRKRIEQISSEYESAGISGRRETSANTELCMNQHAASDIPKIQQSRQIDYRCSASPITKLPALGDRLFSALQTSHQWQWERTVGGTEISDCLNALVPKNRSQDISINLLVGHKSGLQLIDDLEAIRV